MKLESKSKVEKNYHAAVSTPFTNHQIDHSTPLTWWDEQDSSYSALFHRYSLHPLCHVSSFVGFRGQHLPSVSTKCFYLHQCWTEHILLQEFAVWCVWCQGPKQTHWLHSSVTSSQRWCAADIHLARSICFVHGRSSESYPSVINQFGPQFYWSVWSKSLYFYSYQFIKETTNAGENFQTDLWERHFVSVTVLSVYSALF